MEKPIRTVLIVDDQKSNIDLLVEVLQSDYDISIAMDGETALETAAEEPPDLILLDVIMPGIDGYEVCRRLKRIPEIRTIPVIFITAKDQVGDETKGFEVGAVDYIAKPISPPVVLARVRTHLEMKDNREQLERQNQELIEAARMQEEVERIMRHDLKSPLQGILSAPQLFHMCGDPLTPDQKRYLEILEESGLRMLQMINLSLDLYKMEKGIYELNPHRVNLIPLVRKCMAENRGIIDMKRIGCSLKLGGAEATETDAFDVLGEELLCYSLFGNLLKNAAEASPDDDVITVDFVRRADAEGSAEVKTFAEGSAKVKTFARMAEIRIHNRGAVPASIRDRFFEKFVSAGKLSGTGLGTYSAKLMAETQNGDIAMSSDDANGTVVTVRLPVYPSSS